MRIVSNHMKLKAVVLLFMLVALSMAVRADAYVDPGTSGLLTQLIYVLFYGVLGAFLFCIRYIKQILTSPGKFFGRCLGRNDDVEDESK